MLPFHCIVFWVALAQCAVTTVSADRFCQADRVTPVDNDPPGLLGLVGVESKFWASSQLRVVFLNGDDDIQQEVRDVVEQWTDVANIRFLFGGEAAEADIRIRFDPSDGHWSYIGTDANLIEDLNDPTMNLGWDSIDDSTAENRQGTILHEFGHGIGFLHEHYRSDAPWREHLDVPEVLDWCWETQNWDEDTCNHNIIDSVSVDDDEDLVSSDYDVNSIMHYAIRRRWVDDSTELDEELFRDNNQLSAIDVSHAVQVFGPPLGKTEVPIAQQAGNLVLVTSRREDNGNGFCSYVLFVASGHKDYGGSPRSAIVSSQCDGTGVNWPTCTLSASHQDSKVTTYVKADCTQPAGIAVTVLPKRRIWDDVSVSAASTLTNLGTPNARESLVVIETRNQANTNGFCAYVGMLIVGHRDYGGSPQLNIFKSVCDGAGTGPVCTISAGHSEHISLATLKISCNRDVVVRTWELIGDSHGYSPVLITPEGESFTTTNWLVPSRDTVLMAVSRRQDNGNGFCAYVIHVTVGHRDYGGSPKYEVIASQCDGTGVRLPRCEFRFTHDSHISLASVSIKCEQASFVSMQEYGCAPLYDNVDCAFAGRSQCGGKGATECGSCRNDFVSTSLSSNSLCCAGNCPSLGRAACTEGGGDCGDCLNTAVRLGTGRCVVENSLRGSQATDLVLVTSRRQDNGNGFCSYVSFVVSGHKDYGGSPQSSTVSSFCDGTGVKLPTCAISSTHKDTKQTTFIEAVCTQPASVKVTALPKRLLWGDVLVTGGSPEFTQLGTFNSREGILVIETRNQANTNGFCAHVGLLAVGHRDYGGSPQWKVFKSLCDGAGTGPSCTIGANHAEQVGFPTLTARCDRDVMVRSWELIGDSDAYDPVTVVPSESFSSTGWLIPNRDTFLMAVSRRQDNGNGFCAYTIHLTVGHRDYGGSPQYEVVASQCDGTGVRLPTCTFQFNHEGHVSLASVSIKCTQTTIVTLTEYGGTPSPAPPESVGGDMKDAIPEEPTLSPGSPSVESPQPTRERVVAQSPPTADSPSVSPVFALAISMFLILCI